MNLPLFAAETPASSGTMFFDSRVCSNPWQVIGVVLLLFSVSLLVSTLMTPFCKRLAAKIGLMDVPNSEGHKLHRKATPLLGGLAILCGWLAPIIAGVIWISCSQSALPDFVGGLQNVRSELIVICLCAVSSVLLGAIDDKYALKAWKKFLVQFLIVLVAVLFGGIRISVFIPSLWITVPITVFWFLFIMNGINFFDNMDGLAAGTAAIAFLFFAAASCVQGQFFICAISLCAAGAAVGFWFFNAAPASIFMGDAGSHLLGFLIAVISAKATYYNPQIASTRFSVLIPLFILAVPVFDTIAVVLIRLYHHKPVYIGDHNHISHRFVRMGLTRPEAVRLIHLLCVVAGLGALPLLWGDFMTCCVLLLQGIVLLLLLTLLQFNSNRNNPTGESPK